MLHLQDESEFLNFLQESKNATVNTLQLNMKNLEIGEILNIVGHNLESRGEEVLVPTWSEGVLNLLNQKRGFAKTPKPLMMGMCGGPVLDSQNQCVGILEAIVNSLTPSKEATMDDDTRNYWKAVENNAVFITSSQLLSFFDEIKDDVIDVYSN